MSIAQVVITTKEPSSSSHIDNSMNVIHFLFSGSNQLKNHLEEHMKENNVTFTWNNDCCSITIPFDAATTTTPLKIHTLINWIEQGGYKLELYSYASPHFGKSYSRTQHSYVFRQIFY